MTAPLLTALTGDAEIAALFCPTAEIAAMLRFEAALAEAQGGLGIIEANAAAAIATTCRTVQIDEAELRDGLRQDGVTVPDLVRQLRKAAGEASGQVHKGATSQDVIDTGLMLRLRQLFGVLDGRLRQLVDQLDCLSAAFGQQALMAQTRMQAALPFTVADKLATWARPLRHHAIRLNHLSENLPLQLGGPVGDGSSFGPAYPALRADMAARLDLRDAPPWHSDRTPILDVGQALALLTGTLGKIGQDVALMAQTEVRTIALSGGGQSSAMAHKHNPVQAELLVALGRINAGDLGMLAQAMVHENERSGAAWTTEWILLPRMAEAAGRALSVAADLFNGATFPEPSNGR